MKYDVDLQEIDAIRRARNVYEEESAPSGGRKREKECSVAGKRRGKKEKEERGRGRGEAGNIRERLLCYRCHERELFVLSFEEKSEPLLKHNLERHSTGSPVLSSNSEGHRNIVHPREARGHSLPLSLSISCLKERGLNVLSAHFRIHEKEQH